MQYIQVLQSTIDNSLTTVIDDLGVLQAAVDASLTAVSDCGNLGMLGGPDHPVANAQDCLPSLVIENNGETVFSEPTRHQRGLVLGDNPTCDAGAEGMLRYISAQKSVMLCTGTTWIEVGAAPAASGVFTPVTNANLEQVYTSNGVNLSGFFGTRTATVTNGATILVNSVSQGTSANVEAGDSVALRMTSSATANTAKSTTLNLSSYSQTWTVTTRMQDTAPNSFTFADLSNQALSRQVQSAAVTASGFDGPLTVSISGAGSPQLQVAGGTWVSSAPINPGQSLRVRLTTSGSYNSAHMATITLGNYSTTWSATTQSPANLSYSWRYGSWGACSESCGGGTRNRDVYCRRSDGVTVADSNCTSAKPIEQESCNKHDCRWHDVVYKCATPRGNVYMEFGYSGGASTTYIYFQLVGNGNGNSTTACTQASSICPGLCQNGPSRQKCIFYSNRLGRWNIMVNGAWPPPSSVSQQIANSYDCDNYELQSGVTNAMCKASYACTRYK